MNAMKKLRLQAAIKTGKTLTQNDVAEKLKIGSTSVSKWECGRGMPSIEKLPQLAELYGCSVADIIAADPRRVVPRE